MPELLAAALAFPTVVYTILLVVVVVYWLFVVIGALDIDMLNFGDADGMLEGGADGAAEGAAEGLAEGAAEGIAEGAAEGAVEGLADGAAEGAAEALDGAAEALDGAADGVADGAADGVGDDLDLDVTDGGFASLMSALKLRSAPMTVVISSIVVIAWTLSVLGMYYLAGIMPRVVLVPVMGLVAFIVAVPATSVIIRPLAPVFKPNTGRTRNDVVGNTATVTTGRVDARFGQADCVVGGDHLRIEVRARPEKGIKRGQEVLIIEFDDDREAYVVEPLDD